MKVTSSKNIPMTVDPLVAERPLQQIEPEFVDFVGLRQLFGIKRSLAYQLMADGKIKSVSLRRRGALRGKRLFCVRSCREFLRGEMEHAK
jgi:hypothetical protein